MSDLIIAFVTTNSENEALTLSQKLVEGHLAAAVNIVNEIRSVYEWEGEIHDDQEHLLIIKAPKSNTDALKKFIEKHHSYEVPEFVALDVSDSLSAYRQWVLDVTSSRKK